MRDGRTRRLANSSQARPPETFLAKHRATLVVLKGSAVGNEYELGQPRTILGRGPAVDIAIDDATMSRQHVAFEIGTDGLRARDLGSTNGILVNGTTVDAADLKHGDRLKVGAHELQLLLEARDREPPTYVIDVE
jgi:pSer/pThr/pTyr-binding forkhead associated (FHA) protein